MRSPLSPSGVTRRRPGAHAAGRARRTLLRARSWRRALVAVVALALPLVWLTASPAHAASISYVQGAAQAAGSPATTQTLTFSKPVAAGDILVGWFAQYNSPGQVSVSDSVNGAWTRSVSETFSSGGGDIALFFFQNSAP